MELTENTLQILKNFSAINSNIVIKEGNTLQTIAEAKNLLAKAEVAENFPQDFGVYDLSEFLGVLGLVDNPQLEFKDEYVLIADSTGRSKIKYFFSDPDMLTTVTKDVKMPQADVKFTLDNTTLSRIKRAASALGHNELIIEPDSDGTAMLTVSTLENSTANTYSITVPVESTESIYKLVFNINNIKILAGDYDVEISSKLISKFTNSANSMNYWIALEKTSTYGE
jgi:hypothetical protein